MSYVELQHITKCFQDGSQRERTVLQELDLNLEQGSLTAITGESGAGKTTLLNILGTLLMPDRGSYRLGGQPITPQSDLHRLRNREIGFVFQDHRLLPQFTAWQNILLPALAFDNVVGDELQERARYLMSVTGIDKVKDQLPGQLSGGEQSRTAICRALVMQPGLLLADEPTGQLDSRHAREITALLQEVNRTLGTTVVVATHSHELAASADKTWQLKDGKLS
ncbi:MAG: ABC transporter ATP-binding protein [Bacteroidales bacterium]|nr:ABC transporter ATP-binding protein [Bacteroidales bacterium]